MSLETPGFISHVRVHDIIMQFFLLIFGGKRSCIERNWRYL